jgi:hypothetical protein
VDGRKYFVDDYDLEGRVKELQEADPNIISPVYKLQVMILTVLVDIRCLLDKILEKEEGNGYRLL